MFYAMDYQPEPFRIRFKKYLPNEQQIMKDISFPDFFWKKRCITMNCEKWEKYRMDGIVENIMSWDVPEFQWKFNGQTLKQKLKKLSHIEFKFLNVINLSTIDIDSIEIFTKIDAPALLKLNFRQTNISNFSMLKKTKFNKLTSLVFFKSKLVEMEWVGQFWNEELMEIDLEHFPDPELGTDIRWLQKVQSCKIAIVNMSSSKKIKQALVKRVGRKRIPNAIIRTNYD